MGEVEDATMPGGGTDMRGWLRMQGASGRFDMSESGSCRSVSQKAILNRCDTDRGWKVGN